jgi:hypothetical protein
MGAPPAAARRSRVPASDDHRRRTRCALAALRECISQLCITPDSRLGWVIPAVRAGLRAMRRAGHDVIFSTSPYASAHLAALILSGLTRRPWVADFRDPWTGNPFRMSRTPMVERWDGFLERRVVRRASHLVFNTPTLTAHVRDRYGEVRGRCSTILNGFDADLLAEVTPTRCVPEGTFLLTHCGQFYGPRRPHPWFRALRAARARAPQSAARIRLALVGPDHYDGRHLGDIARHEGVGELVLILGPRPHREALSLLAGSDAVVLAGADGPSADLQVPNKLFEYLALRKPILAAIDFGNPAVQILRTAGADAVIRPPGDPEPLADGLLILAAPGRHADPKAWTGAARFERRHGARQLRELFVRLTTRPRDRMRSVDAKPPDWNPAASFPTGLTVHGG